MQRILAIWTAGILLLAVGTASGQPGTSCVEGSDATPARVIEDCEALLADKATAESKLASIFLARSEAFARQGQPQLAIEDLNSAVERRPDSVLAFLKRAELHRTLGDTEAAIGDLTRAIRLEPNHIAARLERAELFRAKGDRRQALADYSAVVRLDPSHEGAAASRKALTLEIERLGATMPLKK